MGTGRRSSDDGEGAYGSHEAADGWRRGAATRAQSVALATEAMLDMANLVIGGRVLDVAAGTGEQTLLAARRVGPTGSVLATDIAANMLKIAAEAARQAGLRNVTTRVMDAQRLDVEPDSFDAVISRLGLMFVRDLAAALTGVRSALKPGGRLAAIVMGSAERSRYITLTLEIACRHARRPASALDRIGLFSLGGPGVFEAALTNAGFSNVTVQAVPTRRWYPSRADTLQDRKNSCPEIGELMADLSDAEREIAWSEIEQAIGQFEGPNGVEVFGEVLDQVGPCFSCTASPRHAEHVLALAVFLLGSGQQPGNPARISIPSGDPLAAVPQLPDFEAGDGGSTETWVRIPSGRLMVRSADV